MKQIRFRLVSAVCLLISFFSQAQSDSSSALDKTQFKLGIFYTSGLNYYGRTDSLQSSGAFPLAEWWLTKNFYINAAPVFVHNKIENLQYAGTVTTAGYQFNHKNKLAGNIYFAKPFYRNNSQLVQSALKEQFSTELTWLNKILDITVGADLKHSDKTDYGVKAGLDHIFRLRLGRKTLLAAVPSVYLYAGTQQFTNTYYKKAGGFLLVPGSQQQVTDAFSRFSILSYEFSAPVVLAKGKLQMLLTPAFVMPQNLLIITGHPELSEKGKNLFYVTTGVKFTF
jgi:hypothetical protein